MSFITWSDFLSIGVPEVDKQHKQLVQMVNCLHDHMLKGDAKDILSRMLARIIELIGIHFVTEERIMKQHEFPHAQEHMREHKKFLDTAVDLQNRFNSEHTDVTGETMEFLDEWLYQHLMVSDKLLGEHILSKACLSCPIRVECMQPA